MPRRINILIAVLVMCACVFLLIYIPKLQLYDLRKGSTDSILKFNSFDYNWLSFHRWKL